MLPTQTANNNITQNDNRPVTPSLMWLRSLLPLSTYWVSEQDKRGRRVARYRRYYDGDHDAKLTKEMRALLRIVDPDDGFTVNMMPTVVDTMMDRCIAIGFDATEDDTAPAKQQPEDADLTTATAPEDEKKPVINAPASWARDLAEQNRFDTLQGDVHTGAGRDGDCYLMASWDNIKKYVRWTYEPAWDGQSGMLMVYPSRNVTEPLAAIKLWQLEASGAALPLPADVAATVTPTLTKPESGTTDALQENTSLIMTRVNIYYKDRVEKYYALGSGSYQKYDMPGEPWQQKWTMPGGDEGIGIPVVHFRNAGRDNYGVSELRNAMSPQNAMNRFNYSAVMAAELTAFSIYIANGFEAPEAITPGMILQMSKALLNSDQKDPTFTKLQATDIKPILEMIDAQRRLISEITRTPSPDLAAGSTSSGSGEYLKQLEVGLIGKVRKFTTRAGQSWEQVLDLSWRIQSAYGIEKPPAYKRFFTRWRTPEIRNDIDVVKMSVMMDPIWGHEETMRQTESVFELGEERIAEIVTQQKAEVASAQAMQQGIVQDSVNPGKGSVNVSEGVENITPGGDTTTPPKGDPQLQQQQPPSANGNAPAIKGAKLPPDQARQVNPISDEEMNAVGQMHRKMMGQPA